MYKVTKLFSFCYGHRLLDYEGKCSHLHGHNARVEITLRTESLDKRGMVMDFSDLKSPLSKWIDENLDHRMILREDDPAVPYLKEIGEPIFLVKENPTAEYIARVIFHYAISLGLPVEEVRFWETESSFAIYREK